MCCGRDLNIQPSTCDANALNQCATPRSIEGPGPLQGQMLAKQQRCIVCEGSGLLCRLLALAEATYRNHYPSSCVVGVTKNFCHIFLWNHSGQLPDIWHNLIKISPFISLSVCFCRSWNERQKQTESEMKGLILIRLLYSQAWFTLSA